MQLEESALRNGRHRLKLTLIAMLKQRRWRSNQRERELKWTQSQKPSELLLETLNA